jgi:hypothetical protein
MPVIQKQVTFAAAGDNPNALTGSAFEFARMNELVSIGACASGAGAVFMTITSGSDVILEESPVVTKAANAWPIIPDEMYYSDFAASGDRLVVKLRATGAAVVNVICQITPV